MDFIRIATYLPSWEDDKGRPTASPDEDVLTLGVAAGRAAIGPNAETVTRVVLVCATPDYLEGSPAALLPAALGLPSDTVVDQRLGGPAAVLDALTSSPAGALVIGVDPLTPAGSGAALLADGNGIVYAGSSSRSLPARIRSVDRLETTQYDDPRLLRERGWKVAIDALRAGGPVGLLGIPPAAAGSLGGDPALETAIPGLTGAAAPFFAVAHVAEHSSPLRLIGIEGASGVAADVDPLKAEVVRLQRNRQPAPRLRATEGEIPVSLAGLDRAQDPKIGFRAGSCTDCGHIEFPPRYRCPQCGSETPAEPVPLGRTGSVYSTVTIHTPVPGKQTPYSIAIVDLDEPPLRVLAPVTDAPPGTVEIGQRGQLVLRRVAVRQGIPDYMQSFQPAEED